MEGQGCDGGDKVVIGDPPTMENPVEGEPYSSKQTIKVQMKCFFLLLNLKEQQKSGRSPFTVS